MAWQDILGGLAGGLSQGLGQVQQNVEARRRNDATTKQLALQALQEKRAEMEAARQAALTQYGSLEEGVEQDPALLAEIMKVVGPGAFVKGPSGRGLMKKPKPQNALAELQLDEFKAGTGVRQAQQQSEAQKSKFVLSGMQHFEKTYGPDWVQKIDSMTPREQALAGVLMMGNRNALTDADQQTAIQVATINKEATLGAAATNAEAMRSLREAQRGTIANDDNARLQQLFIDEKAKLDPMAQVRYMQNPALAQKEFAEWLATRQRMGVAPTSGMKLLGIEQP